MEKQFYTTTELADIFSKKPQTIRTWVAMNRFPNCYLVGKTWVIPSEDVEAVKQEEAGKLVEQLESLGYSFLPQ